MKVCFVSHSSGKYGAEKALIELILGLRQRGVTCCVILPKPGPLAEELRARGITFRVLPYPRWMGKGRKGSQLGKRILRTVLNLAAAVRLAATIRQWECDILYTNTITICVGALAAWFAGRPHIWHIHEFVYDRRFDLGERFSMGLVDRFSLMCIVSSTAVADGYRRYLAESKLRVVYQAVTLPEILPPLAVCGPDGRQFTCVIIGSLLEIKGQEDAIRALAELRDQDVDIKLTIVGDAKKEGYKTFLRRLVNDLALASQVTFAGYLSNPFPMMNEADAVLVCSRLEAFGRVTVEAMLLCKPVIGASTGGTAELIQDGVNGLLYTPGDPKGLAAKIKYLHDHPEEAVRIACNARAQASGRFTQDRYAGNILSIMQESLTFEDE